MGEYTDELSHPVRVAMTGFVGLGWSVAAAIGMSLSGNLADGFLASAGG
jgi:hypothetical protein